MEIKYKILHVIPDEHAIVVRYYSDDCTLTTEDALCSARNEDGSIFSCRTDYSITVWQTPSPTADELRKVIMASAPVQWLKTLAAVADPLVDTSLSSALQGSTGAFTDQEQQAMSTPSLADAVGPEIAALFEGQ
jgi:hypothetical protein